MHCARVRAFVRICPGHNSYFYAWISKLFDTVVVLEEEKCHLKHFLGSLNVKVTLESHINELFWTITHIYIYICMDFKIMLHRCSPGRVKVPF